MPLDIVMETNDKEKKRQECIYELVYTEQDFTRDLQYIKEVPFYNKTRLYI